LSASDLHATLADIYLLKMCDVTRPGDESTQLSAVMSAPTGLRRATDSASSTGHDTAGMKGIETAGEGETISRFVG
jgi:hypothetical protein